MNKWILYSAIITFCCAGVFLKFNTHQENIPTGCDEFGYMNLAKAFDKKIAFQDHAQRPYLTELLDTLRHSSITENEIEWMVVPHAYYVIPGSDKIINQYPPGTSYLLSLFSLPLRKQLFSAFAIFLFILIPLLIIHVKRDVKFGWFDLALIAFVLVMTLTAPFLTELTRINSLAFTFGLLVGAGILLDSRPLLSCFLIVLSANFRVVNLLLLLPLCTFIPFQQLLKEGIFSLFRACLKYIAVTIIAIAPYLLYTYFLLGNPFTPTYSAIDTAATKSGLDNISYYFNLNQGWFIFHLMLIAAFFILTYFKKMQWSLFFKLLLFPLVNYLFFIFHKVQINYYPYASSLILLGIFFNEIRKFTIAEKYRKLIVVFCSIISIIVFCDGIQRYMAREHKTFIEKKSEYTGLCAYDVVWGELLSGTSEYVCDNNGFKYAATSARARMKTMRFLHNRKYSQAILLNDNLVEKPIVIEEVKSSGLKFHIVTDEFIGEILVIE
ncbi:MAG: hypothetical protein ACT4ON_08865 [Bacteroidota bacterium]